MRKPPDIEAVARLGGLPDSVKPYKLDNQKGDFYSAQHGNSTETVNRFLEPGFAKVVETARDYSLRFKTASPSEIGKHIPNIGWAGDTWIEENILRSERSVEELGKELRDKLIADIPEVNRCGVAPATPAEATERGAAFLSPRNRFVKEGDTWTISFAGEICRLAAAMIGLDYILVLLQYPGRPMRALELQSLLAGSPIASRPASKLAAEDVTVDAHTDRHEDECSLSSRGHSSGDDQLDPKAIKQYQQRLKELERDATTAYNVGDSEKGDELQKQYDEIQSGLNKSFDIRLRPRAFSDDNEKARISVTKALKRAYNKIRPQSRKTAEYIESHIKTGSEFVYLDNSITWEL